MLSHLAGRLPGTGVISLCDPFAGDGRLAWWLIAEAASHGITASWQVELWDIDTCALAEAAARAGDLSARHGVSISVRVRELDSLVSAPGFFGRFDVVVTNPPWETLKPDRRKLGHLDTEATGRYVRELRAYDSAVTALYPRARAGRRFGGWGTNLARAGAEAAVRLTRRGGVTGLVAPGPLLADELSAPFRAWLTGSAALHHIAYYPAETRAFEAADVAAVTVVLTPGEGSRDPAPLVSIHDRSLALREEGRVALPHDFLAGNGHAIPISFGLAACSLLRSFSTLPRFGDLEGASGSGLWAGRELDETRVCSVLRAGGDPQFIRGRMISRFAVRERPAMSVCKPGWAAPASVGQERIAWRDVSRHNQKRRVIATLIPPGWVAGNSLGVAHFRDGDPARLRWLLGIMSSLVFEIQLRGLLATGHVSLGSVRKVHVPAYGANRGLDRLLAGLVTRRLAGDEAAEPRIEAVTAQLYQLREPETLAVITQFPKLTAAERDMIMKSFREAGPAAAAGS